jgi:nucleoside-diphosphate-sugar epimerase
MSRDCTIRDAKARAELGYRPVITLDQGLARLAA